MFFIFCSLFTLRSYQLRTRKVASLRSLKLLMVGTSWLIKRFQRATGAAVTYDVVRLQLKFSAHRQRAGV